MAKNRKGTTAILIDIHYMYPLNKFEEFYGDWVSYSEIEQASYIDLKEMVFELVNPKVRFRKFGREKNVLTVKADMSPSEYELFLRIFRGEEVDTEATEDVDKNPDGKTKYKKFRFLHDFVISNIRDLTKAESIKFKKMTVEEAEAEETTEETEG